MAILVLSCVMPWAGATGFPAASSKEQMLPTLALLHHIEVDLSLPRGARKLDDYVRYYSVETVKNVTTIRATFFYSGAAGRIVRVQPSQLPHIEDGGCDVIQLLYSPKAGKVLSISCNGVA